MKLLAAIFATAILFAAPMATVDEAGYAKLVAAAKGKVLLVNFWATWCAPCRAEMPLLLTLDRKLKDKGFQLVLVSADEPEQHALASKFLSEVKATAPSFVKQSRDDDKFIQAVDPKWSGAVPALFLYDKSGKRVRSFIGETPVSVIEAAARKLL